MLSRRPFTKLLARFVTSRGCQSRNVSHHPSVILHDQIGNPAEVLMKKEIANPELGDNQVLIKMVASPINPSDLLMIDGKYGTKAELPAIPGNEGVGIVEAVGRNVDNLELGDHVVPVKLHLGTWRTHLVGNVEDFTSLDKRVPFPAAATIFGNPCTAYRMLKDFGTVKGDTVIQNGANSGVGQAVIQIAKVFGLRTVNVVRERDDFKDVADYLSSLGADYVVTDAELRKPEIKELWGNKISKPKLALDCVAGKNATEMMRHLGPGGVLVNYGGMSMQPIAAPVSALIFKEISIHGFWFSLWQSRNPTSASVDMIQEIAKMIVDNKLQAPAHDLVRMEDFKKAIQAAMTPYLGRKQILVMDDQSLQL